MIGSERERERKKRDDSRVSDMIIPEKEREEIRGKGIEIKVKGQD